jgi:hypothetical protein
VVPKKKKKIFFFTTAQIVDMRMQSKEEWNKAHYPLKN